MTPTQRETLVIDNRLDEFKRVEQWLAKVAEDWALSPSTTFAVDLVVNEAVTNTISHGYRDTSVHQIEITLTDAGDGVSIEITDDAMPFDPFSLPPMAIGTDLESASIGGRGIHLIKSYTDMRDYRFISGQNRLKLLIFKKP
jgi:anti-sigma regulatory factor (Ser/Thr protein kinase)